MAWSPPEVSAAPAASWRPPEVGGPEQPFNMNMEPADDDSPEAAEAKALYSGTLAGAHMLAAGTLGQLGKATGYLQEFGSRYISPKVFGEDKDIDPEKIGAEEAAKLPAPAEGSQAAGAESALGTGLSKVTGQLLRPTADVLADAGVPSSITSRIPRPSPELVGALGAAGEVINTVGAAEGAGAPIRAPVNAIRGKLAARAAVRASTEAATAAEAAPKADAAAHLEAQGVPVNGVPVEGAPGRTRPATGTELSEGYNRAVLRHVGADPAEAHDPLQALPNARTRITSGMDEIGARTNPMFDTELAGDLQRVRNQIPMRVPQNDAAPLHANIDAIIQAAADNGGHIPGPALQQINTNLRALEANPALAETAGDLHEALQDAVGRHADPADIQQLGQLRQQYRNLKQIEGAVDPVTGHIDPKRLMTQLAAKKNRNQLLYGAGDQALLATARAGARVLPDMQSGLAAANAPTSRAATIRNRIANVVEGGTLGAVGAKVGGAVGGLPGAAIGGAIGAGTELLGAGPAVRGGLVRAMGGSPEEVAVARGQRPLGATIRGGRMRGAVGDLSNNASGESAASQEAVNRVAQERAQGRNRYQIDPDGNVTPLTGVDAVDARAPNGHVIIRTGTGVPGAPYEVMDRGGLAGRNAYGLVARATRNIQAAEVEAHAARLQGRGGAAVEGPRTNTQPLGETLRGGRERGAVGAPTRNAGSFGGRGSEEQIHETMGTQPPAAGTATHPPLQGGPQAGSTRVPLGQLPAFRRQAGFARLSRAEPEPETPATLNIGHNVGGEKNKLGYDRVQTALKKVGAQVTSHDVIAPGEDTPNLFERTSVVGLKNKLTEKQGQALARELGQDAIAQRTGEGTGNMFVQPKARARAEAEGWNNFNGDYFHHADRLTETQHQNAGFNPAELEAAKPQQTVNNPKNNHYPGIYDDPKDIASRVETAPEDPIMQRLFGKTRKQLHDDALSRGDVAPESIPGVNEGGRAKGSAAGKNVTTDANAQRLRDTITAFRDAHPDAYHGMVGWYEMQALHDKILSIVKDPKAASMIYDRLNTMMGMASPGSDVVTEIGRGTAARMMAEKGEFSKFEKYGGNPGSRGAMKNAPELANISGHPYHSTSQAVPMRRYLDTGVGAQAPKTSMYIRASDAPNRIGSKFQNKVLVGDSHFSRGVGLSDVRTSADPHGSISGPELADIHPWYHENVAKPLGMPSTSAQAVQWGALSKETGVETAIGAPKLEIFSQEVAKAAKRAGVEPEEMLERIIKGTAHAG